MWDLSSPARDQTHALQPKLRVLTIGLAGKSEFVCFLFFFASIYSVLGLPCGPAGKESACNAGDLGLIPGLGSSPGEGNGCPLQYSGLENSMDCVVPGVAKSRT